MIINQATNIINKIKSFWLKFQSEDRHLIKNSFWNLSGSVFSKIILLSTSVFVARFLGANIYGEWGVIRSTAFMFTTFLSFGVGVTAMKHLAEYRKSNPAKASRIFSISFFSAIFFGILLTTTMYFSSEFLAVHVLRNNKIVLPLKISSFYLILTAFSGVFSGALMGLDAYKKLAFANLYISIIGAPIIIIFTYYFKLFGISSAYIFYYLITIIFYYTILKKELVKNNIAITTKGVTKELPLLYKFSVPAMISGAIGGPVVWTANAVVARMTNGFTIIGILNAAKIAQNTIIEIGNQINNPLITLVSNNKTQRSNVLSFYVPTIFITIFILPFLFFPELIGWMFSKRDFLVPEFGLVVSITMLTAYIIVFKQSLSRLMITNNKVWWGVYENILWSIILLSIITTLTKSYSTTGLALAYFAAYFIDLIVIFPFYYYAKMVPGFILYNKRFIIAFATILIAPILIYYDAPTYMRIIIYLISLIAHFIYLSIFRNNRTKF